jgi:lipoprotein-releasing system permease protein
MFLPYPWWKLGFLWLAGLKSRRAPGRGKALFQNSLRVAIIGLAFGVAALSITLSIVSGFQRRLAVSVSSSLGHVAQFTKWRTQAELERFVKLAPSGVERVEAIWMSQALVVGKKGGRGVMVEGRRTIYPKSAKHTKDLDSESSNLRTVTVKIGKALADYIGVHQGDTIKILLPGIFQSPIPAMVTALVDHGMYNIDSRLLWVDDTSLKEFLSLEAPGELSKRPGDAHGLRFYLDKKFSSPTQQQALLNWKNAYAEKLSADPRLGESSPILRTWEEQKRNVFGGIGMDKLYLTVVMSLLTLVAVLNVASTLVVLFLERDRDLAVLQALGMSRGQLIQWVTFQGFLTGLVGAVLGLAVSFGIALLLERLPIAQIPADVYNLSRVPFSFEWKEQVSVFGFGLLAALVVSLGVALRLSKVQLVQLMGYRR